MVEAYPAQASQEPEPSGCGIEGVDIGRFGDDDSHALPVDRDLSAGDGVVVGEDPDLVVSSLAQLYHRPPAHFQELVHE